MNAFGSQVMGDQAVLFLSPRRAFRWGRRLLPVGVVAVALMVGGEAAAA